MIDVAVIGAGFSGLACARSLDALGYSVILIEKSRGLGGRAATRRIEGTQFNYGVPYLDEPRGSHINTLLNEIREYNAKSDGDQSSLDLKEWPLKTWALAEDGTYYRQPQRQNFVPTTGMTAIAKYLAQNLTIHRQNRVQALHIGSNGIWDIVVEPQSAPHINARAVILAIPAPQIIPILEPLKKLKKTPTFQDALHSVVFSPCITVTAGYDSAEFLNHPTMKNDWDAIQFSAYHAIRWVGVSRSIESQLIQHPAGLSKPKHDVKSKTACIVNLQSGLEYAQCNIENANKINVGDRLLKSLDQQLLTESTLQLLWRHVHYWRYAFCSHPLPQTYLLSQYPGIIGCTGDWCGGNRIEDALISGQTLASAISRTLSKNF